MSRYLGFSLCVLILAACLSPNGGASQHTAEPVPIDTVAPPLAAPPSAKSLAYNPHPAPDDIIDTQGVPMRIVPAGEFAMGSDKGDRDEKPVHTVSLGAYMIDKYEVSNARYAACVFAWKCAAPSATSSTHYNIYADPPLIYYGNPEFENYPVDSMDWNMAKAYCAWRGARLPSEAEWEKAARGGLDGKNYPWGDDAPVYETGAENGANFFDDNKTKGFYSPVGSYAPNGYGLYDMAGNVWEWTADWYSAYPGNTTQNSSFGTEYRIVRGGSLDDGPYKLRVSYRDKLYANYPNYVSGVRCARSSP